MVRGMINDYKAVIRLMNRCVVIHLKLIIYSMELYNWPLRLDILLVKNNNKIE